MDTNDTMSMSMTPMELGLSPNDCVHLRMHGVRFYNLPPRSIKCISLCKKAPKLALCRKDSSIEIWDILSKPCLEKVIPTQENLNIEAVAWYQKRLYSVGQSGELIEWNLDTLRPRYRQYATGSCVWCIDVNEATRNIAIGTEEGFINIFRAERDGTQFHQLFDKQDKRVLCCKFNKAGDRLVTGSLGVVRIWDVNTGYALTKMALRRGNTKQELIVWSVDIFKNMTIVSGDSRGHITFWDGETGAQIQTQKALDADILSLAISDDEETVLCSGIDPIIRLYAKVKIKRDNCELDRWIRTLQRSVHDHDVLTLASQGDKIYSGSLDGYLGVSSLLKRDRSITKYGPFLKTPWLSASSNRNMILLRYPQRLEVWRLGSAPAPSYINADNDCKSLKPTLLESSPKKIYHINVQDDYSIVCAAISPDANFLCFSTLAILKLFRMEIDANERGSLVLIESKDLATEIATHMQFDENSERLFIVNSDTKNIMIYLIRQNGHEVELCDTIDIEDMCIGGINMFTISDDGNAFVLVNGNNIASVWFKDDGVSNLNIVEVPQYEQMITAVAIRPDKKQVLLAYADNKLVEYDLKELTFISSTTCEFGESEKTIAGILIDRRDPSILIVQTDEFMCTVQICKNDIIQHDDDSEDIDCIPHAKKKRKIHTITPRSLNRFELIGAVPLKHFVGMAHGAIGEIVAVNINPLALLEQLPKGFQKIRFGVS